MPVDSGQFRRAMGQFATGVTVVTARTPEGRPLGLTVSAFCSLSLDPPLVVVCIDRRSETNDGLRVAATFAVSILAEGQEHWSRRFAGSGSAKFEGVDLLSGESGDALVPGALAHIECRVTAIHPGGDHLVYVGEVVRLAVHPGRPLLYHASDYRGLAPGPRP